MFLLNEIIFFAPLVLYALLRVGALMPKRWARFAWGFIALFLLLGFPLAESLSHRGADGWRRTAMILGYDSWVLLLYLVLTIVAVDLAVGAARLTRLVPKERVRSPRFRAVRLGFVLIVPALIVLAGVRNYQTLRVKAYDVEVPRRSSSLSELRIAFASDLHLGDRTAAGFMDDFVAKVNALEPDVVLIGGDVLEGDRREERLARYEAGFRRLRSRYGVFGVPGNHEGYAGGQAEFFAESGIRLLRDEVVRTDDAFLLAGRKDQRSRDRKPLAALLAGTPDDLPVILLDHRPTDLESASRSTADIQLSGHTHHGQLFPVNLVTNHRYELSWGYKKKGRTHVFVTSGVQLWGPPVRTAGRSEILFIRVALRGPERSGAPACTAFVLEGRGALFLARNFDGPVGDGLVFVNRRGVAKQAFDQGTAGAPPLRWTSKHGSVTFNRFGREFPLGGLNEAGLAIEALAGPAGYPPPDARPALNELQWIQYQLDTAGSVKDVLRSDADLRVSKLLVDLHYLVADRKGNAAVVEFAGGKRAAATGGALAVPVLANDAYAESVRALGRHDGPGGERPVPDGPGSPERFVRAATALRELEALGQAPVVDDAFVALKSVEGDDTLWSVAYNLPRRLVFFKTRTRRRYKIVALDRLDFAAGGPALMLPVDTEDSWDLNATFKPYDAERNRLLVESSLAGLGSPPPPPEVVRAMAAYPESCR
jgi:predicted MPP superfamily phosphohydrolase/penicillin V acylase-like amidase (Ntn superfamily)